MIMKRTFIRTFFVLFLGWVATTTLFAQTLVITHDIGTGSLTIPGASTNNYVITGTTTTNTVIIQTGYHGTITLQNLSITSSATNLVLTAYTSGGVTNQVVHQNNENNYGLSGYSCITVEGAYNQSNLSPVTIVHFILEGTNTLTYTSNIGGYCPLQVNQGAQIYIDAIDHNNDASGTLSARCTGTANGNVGGGAGIGAPNFRANNTGTGPGVNNIGQGIATITCTGGGTAASNVTAGGNVLIGSGTITAQGGHAAGIGGGWYTYYDGIVVVYGGIVDASSGWHAAGIGSGCAYGSGVNTCSAPNSMIVALPPAQISSCGRNNPSPNPPAPGTQCNARWELAGSTHITYIGDPSKPLITLRTVDSLPYANMYLDLTTIPGLVNAFNSIGFDYNLAKVLLGTTNASGIFQIRAELQQRTTFYTDASSIKPATMGRPYLPKDTSVTGTQSTTMSVILPLLPTNISFTDYPSTPLLVGYTAPAALQNAHCIKVNYNDPLPMGNVTFALQDGIDFSSLAFLASDSVTVIPPPTTLTNGMVFYIIVPIDVGKPINLYSDILYIEGTYNSKPTGRIRRIVRQLVIIDDRLTNTYIKVTASPNKFSTTYPTTNTVTLTLNIDHTGTPIPYDYSSVVAKYLVTSEPNYDLALAATPLSGWSSLNIPPANNTNTNTIVPFSPMPAGTYYIHWYVETGIGYAHSSDVVNPPMLYGGFGPYLIHVPLMDTVCAGSSATYFIEAVNSSIAEYQWFVNGSPYLGATDSVFTYIPANGDIVVCRVISDAMCPDTVFSPQATITVRICYCAFTPISPKDLNICAGTNINICFSAGADIGNVSASGLPPDVTTSWNGAHTIFCITGAPTTVGTFNYTLTPNAPCAASAVSGTIIITPKVVPKAKVKITH